MNVAGTFVSEGGEKQSASGEVNHRRAHNAHLGSDIMIGTVTIAEIVVGGHRRDSQADLPIQAPVGTRIAVGIACVHTVVHRRHKHDVVRALPRNGKARDDERLGIDLAVHRISEKPAEGVGIDVSGGKNSFVGVLAGAGEVIVVGQDVDLRFGAQRPGQEKRRDQNACGCRF